MRGVLWILDLVSGSYFRYPHCDLWPQYLFFSSNNCLWKFEPHGAEAEEAVVMTPSSAKFVVQQDWNKSTTYTVRIKILLFTRYVFFFWDERNESCWSNILNTLKKTLKKFYYQRRWSRAANKCYERSRTSSGVRRVSGMVSLGEAWPDLPLQALLRSDSQQATISWTTYYLYWGHRNRRKNFLFFVTAKSESELQATSVGLRRKSEQPIHTAAVWWYRLWCHT